MVATVNGRLHVKKEYGAKTQQVIGERTSKTNKETQSRSAIIIDSATMPTNGTIKGPPRSLPNKPPVASPVPSSSSNPRAVQTAPGVFTPPKSDGSPSSSTSVIRGQKHAVPAAFNTLDLTIPTDWTGPIPVAIRVIHTVVLSPKFESEVLRDKDMGVTDAAEQKEALRACGIVSKMRQSLSRTSPIHFSYAIDKPIRPFVSKMKPITIYDHSYGFTTLRPPDLMSPKTCALPLESLATTTMTKFGNFYVGETVG
jgi:hypothetical protein